MAIIASGRYSYFAADADHTKNRIQFLYRRLDPGSSQLHLQLFLPYDNFQAIYNNQSEDLTILGGTFWIDTGIALFL